MKAPAGFERSQRAIETHKAIQAAQLGAPREASGFSFHLLTNIDVQLQVARSRIGRSSLYASGQQPRFVLQGPATALTLLKRVLRGATLPATHGQLSPITLLTLPEDARRAAGIPVEATHYSFAYPMECLAELADIEETLSHFTGGLSPSAQSTEAVLLFCLLGGYVYCAYDGADVVVVAVNCLSLSSSANAELHFEGPFLAPIAVGDALEGAGRMSTVSIGRLRDAGVDQFCWVNPRERPGGVPLWKYDVPHGAFIYRMADPDARPFFYLVRPGTATEGTTTFPGKDKAPKGSDVPGAMAVHQAFTEMFTTFSMNKTDTHHLKDDLAEWRKTPMQKWLLKFGIYFFLYYVVGILTYGWLEGWEYLDVCYYLTTTVTTVGYGDFAPATAEARWFTSVFAPLGTITVMTALLPPVEWFLSQVDQLFAWPVYELESLLLSLLASRWELIRRHFREGHLQGGNRKKEGKRELLDAEKHRQMLRGTHSAFLVELSGLGDNTYTVGAYSAYLHALLGPMLLTVSGVAFACTVKGYEMHDSVYWTIITMTTVGYGDLVPVGTLQKMATMCFMPLAATTLAATVERFDKLNTARRIHETNYTLVADEMLREEALADQTLHPTLTEDAFILRVLVQMNLVEEQTLKELKGRYAMMLNKGKGRLDAEGRLDLDASSKVIDAELVYNLLVLQGRVVDSNDVKVAAAPAAAYGAQDKARTTWRLAEKSITRDEATKRRSSGGVGLGRGATRGALSMRGDGRHHAVDMSTKDNGFHEWHERHWLPSLEEIGVESNRQGIAGGFVSFVKKQADGHVHGAYTKLDDAVDHLQEAEQQLPPAASLPPPAPPMVPGLALPSTPPPIESQAAARQMTDLQA